MRDKEPVEMKKLSIKGQVTGRRLKRIKQRIAREMFAVVWFNFEKGIIQVWRQARMPHSVRV